MIAAEYLVEIFSFIDRKFLETVIRQVSRKIGAILNGYFPESPYHVIDVIDVDLYEKHFFLNDVNIYSDVIRVEFTQTFDVKFDMEFRPIRRAIRHEKRHFDRDALPGGGASLPCFLRVLGARFSLHSSENPEFANQEGVLREVISAFASTWDGYAPGHVTFEYSREDFHVVGELLELTSAAALTLFCRDFEVLGTGFLSLFDLRAVCECARLEILYTCAEIHFWYSSYSPLIPMNVRWRSAAVAWLRSAPKVRSSHRIAERAADGTPRKQRERVAKVASRELQFNCPNWKTKFEYYEKFVSAVANAFVNDTERRQFKLEFNFCEILPELQPPSLPVAMTALTNERTRETLRFERRKWDENAYYRDTFHVTRLPPSFPPS